MKLAGNSGVSAAQVAARGNQYRLFRRPSGTGLNPLTPAEPVNELNNDFFKDIGLRHCYRRTRESGSGRSP